MAPRQPDMPDPAELADDQLARRTRAGSEACFAELVSRHEGRLMWFLVQRTRHVHDAEDLLQETFVRAYQHIASYDPTWKFTTWLFTIASRLACSHFRKKRPLPTTDRMLGLAASGENDPSASMSRREEKDRLWSLAAKVLSDNQYTALWFRYAEEMSIRDVSRVMDKTQTHVKVLLFRGRTTLGKKLELVGEAVSPAGSSNSDARAALASTAVRGGG